MLVLSRKAGERIHIGDQITIEVRRVSGNRVALAVQAPKDVRILRGELKESATDFDNVSHEHLSIVVDDASLGSVAASA